MFDLVCEVRNLNTALYQIVKILKDIAKDLKDNEKTEGGTKK